MVVVTEIFVCIIVSIISNQSKVITYWSSTLPSRNLSKELTMGIDNLYVYVQLINMQSLKEKLIQGGFIYGCSNIEC